MQLLRSLLFAALFYPGTAIYVFAGLAGSVIGERQTRAVVHGWADFHYWLARHLLGIRSVVVEGSIPPGPVLIAVKHQSMYETIEILRLADTPAVVMKRELSDLPFFGLLTRRYGVIPVDRQAGASALREMLARGRAAVADQRPVAIFPEGTRVAPGTSPELRAGFAGLYRALGLPVVPIAHDSGRLWGKGLLKTPGDVHFKIGEVIPVGLKRDEVERRVHAAINALETSAP